MAVTSAQITVTTTPVALSTADVSGNRITIMNGSAVIYLGNSAVTTTTGLAVNSLAVLTVELDPGDVLYAVCATSSAASVLRT